MENTNVKSCLIVVCDTMLLAAPRKQIPESCEKEIKVMGFFIVDSRGFHRTLKF